MSIINNSSNKLVISGGVDYKIWLYNYDKELIS